MAKKEVKKITKPSVEEAPYGYEVYDFPVVDIELDFDEKQFKTLKKAAKIGGFVSVSEFVRHTLRTYMLEDK